MGSRAAADGRSRRQSGGGEAGLRNNRLHELSHHQRHGGQRPLWSGSGTFDEPRHHRIRRGRQHRRKSAAVGPESGRDQTRFIDARDETQRPGSRCADGVSGDAAIGGGKPAMSTEAIGIGSMEGTGPLWTEVAHEWVTTVDHKRLGILYIVYALLFLVIA